MIQITSTLKPFIIGFKKGGCVQNCRKCQNVKPTNEEELGCWSQWTLYEHWKRMVSIVIEYKNSRQYFMTTTLDELNFVKPWRKNKMITICFIHFLYIGNTILASANNFLIDGSLNAINFGDICFPQDGCSNHNAQTLTISAKDVSRSIDIYVASQIIRFIFEWFISLGISERICLSACIAESYQSWWIMGENYSPLC